MRLSEEQISTLILSTHRCFGENARIWLFGSRVDDKKKGGDIDLYIETDIEKGIVAAKLKLLECLWPTFGEQKIDILIHSRNDPSTPMHEIAKSTGKELTLID